MASYRPVVVTSSSILFQPDGHSNEVLSGLHKERQKGNFVDFCIRVGGREIRGHCVVLAAAIPYISGLLHVGGAQQDEITLDELDGQAVSDLVDFVYTGQLHITPENVQDLLVAADYFNMAMVCRECCRFLQERLSTDCCTAVFHLAEHMALAELKEAAVAYIRDNIEEVASEAGDFQTLPVSTLLRILGDEKLCLHGSSKQLLDPASQEYALALIVLQYVEGNLGDNVQHLFDLLRSVRLPVISHANAMALNKTLVQLQLRCASEGVPFDNRCLEVIAEADNMQLEEPTNETADAWCRPRRYPGKINHKTTK